MDKYIKIDEILNACKSKPESEETVKDAWKQLEEFSPKNLAYSAQHQETFFVIDGYKDGSLCPPSIPSARFIPNGAIRLEKSIQAMNFAKYGQTRVYPTYDAALGS